MTVSLCTFVRRSALWVAVFRNCCCTVGSINEIEQTFNASPAELLTLNEALTILAETHPRKAKLVELRFFAGLTNREAAEVLEISTSTADQDWRYARAWLKVKMDGNSEDHVR